MTSYGLLHRSFLTAAFVGAIAACDTSPAPSTNMVATADRAQGTVAKPSEDAEKDSDDGGAGRQREDSPRKEEQRGRPPEPMSSSGGALPGEAPRPGQSQGFSELEKSLQAQPEDKLKKHLRDAANSAGTVGEALGNEDQKGSGPALPASPKSRPAGAVTRVVTGSFPEAFHERVRALEGLYHQAGAASEEYLSSRTRESWDSANELINSGSAQSDEMVSEHPSYPGLSELRGKFEDLRNQLGNAPK